MVPALPPTVRSSTAAIQTRRRGARLAFLQSISTISQTISGFVPGANYTVTFSAAQRAGQYQHGRQTWNLKVDNSAIASYSPPATATNYVDYTANFTATAATHTLSFVGTDLVGGDNTAFLDNVRITPAPSLTPVQLGSRLTSSGAGNQIQLFVASRPHWLEAANADESSWAPIGSMCRTQIITTRALTPATNSSVFFRLAYP